jgi:hypothetical protein
VSRRTSTLSSADMSTRNVEMAATPPKISSLAKDEARALGLLEAS